MYGVSELARTFSKCINILTVSSVEGMNFIRSTMMSEKVRLRKFNMEILFFLVRTTFSSYQPGLIVVLFWQEEIFHEI